MKLLISIGVLAAAGVAAANQVVPNNFDNVAGNLSFALTSTTAGGRVYQYQINQNQLTSLVGQNLNGMQWRLNESIATDWPAVSTSYTDFSIFIGTGTGPAARSATFAANFVGTPTQVRSGPLTFDANAFSAVGAPVKPFGPVISFSDYLYTGGHLTIELRFAQQVGSTSAPTFDGCGSATPGYGTDFAASWGTPSTGTSANQSTTANFLVTNLIATPVPEPATMVALGLGVLALARRRRRA